MLFGYSKRLRSRLARRAAVLLAMLSALAGPLELIIPEIHDGDAQSGAALLTAVPRSELPTSASAEDAALSSLDEAQGLGQSDSSHSAPSTPGHSFHVDHCVHAHVLDVQRAFVRCAPSAPAQSRIETSVPQLTSVTTAPSSRPPIA